MTGEAVAVERRCRVLDRRFTERNDLVFHLERGALW